MHTIKLVYIISVQRERTSNPGFTALFLQLIWIFVIVSSISFWFFGFSSTSLASIPPTFAMDRWYNGIVCTIRIYMFRFKMWCESARARVCLIYIFKVIFLNEKILLLLWFILIVVNAATVLCTLWLCVLYIAACCLLAWYLRLFFCMLPAEAQTSYDLRAVDIQQWHRTYTNLLFCFWWDFSYHFKCVSVCLELCSGFFGTSGKINRYN